MTRNEQPGIDPGLYDQHFYRWTQRQAAALRAVPGEPAGDPAGVDLVPHLDIAHLAEAIEDLGKRDLREVVSSLRLVIQHLVKRHAVPDARDAAHWHNRDRQCSAGGARRFLSQHAPRHRYRRHLARRLPRRRALPAGSRRPRSVAGCVSVHAG